VVAFSRATPKKVYVQDRLKERVEDVEGLLRGNASVYVCGNAANMARDVKSTLVEIITQERGVIPADAEKVLMSMKTSGEYQVRVSICPYMLW
jgi:NADPH-ferrihemoprotein reductase